MKPLEEVDDERKISGEWLRRSMSCRNSKQEQDHQDQHDLLTSNISGKHLKTEKEILELNCRTSKREPWLAQKYFVTVFSFHLYLPVVRG